MKPEFDLLGITIQSYPLMLALAFGAAIVVLERAAEERGLPGRWVLEGTAVALVAGIIGARGYSLLQQAGDPELGLGEALGTGGGLTWYGGFALGAVAVALWGRWRGVPWLVAADGAAVALPIAQVLGRIGCHLAGDGDYGPPSDLPWAVGYPDGEVPTPPGVEVHPTPIYEALALLAIFAWTWRHRHSFCDGALFGFYLIAAGLERLLAEELRLNDEVLAGLTAAQLQSIAAMAAGAVLLAVLRRRGGLRRDGVVDPSRRATGVVSVR